MSTSEAPHGGDGEAVARRLGIDPADLLDLSASLNPVAPDPAPVVARHLDSLGRYPDDGRATAALAEAVGVDRSRLVLTNGGAEAIALVGQLHPTGWAEELDFSLYRRHLRVLDPDGPRWMSDPNNPTGRLATADETAAVRDEAFYPLATGSWTRGDAGTIALGSLTKVFACPGLRLGHVIAPDDETAEALRRLRPRWSVGGLACAALPDLLATADLPGWAGQIAVLRAEMEGILEAHGLRPSPGAANYLWIPQAPHLRERLLEQRILVRSGVSFGAPDAVRIAVPPPSGLDRLAEALTRTEVHHG
ncbi:aminotransferase class I/II-fold pyridoxal phosphate-dependent enzyme [Aquihabitans daechungensis]|uniref:aminotransferase class I/II-fold pyridoxal phosphate-dependent enzyme n=1 Tax=Aquihabitans daechungensis TaxID=1052257 RepID=UPI003B9EE907